MKAFERTRCGQYLALREEEEYRKLQHEMLHLISLVQFKQKGMGQKIRGTYEGNKIAH
jgi:hypothetical protein